jgi:hypothetical protein
MTIGIIALGWSREEMVGVPMEWVVVDCPVCEHSYAMPHEGPLPRHERSQPLYDMERITPIANGFAHLLGEECPNHEARWHPLRKRENGGGGREGAPGGDPAARHRGAGGGGRRRSAHGAHGDDDGG